jgi:hypothetical protein
MQKFIRHNRVRVSYQFGRHDHYHRHHHPRHALMQNLSDTIVLGRVINLGDTTDVTDATIH